MPDLSRKKIAKLSREPRFLLQSSLTVVLIAVMISGLIAALFPPSRGEELGHKIASVLMVDADIDPDLDAESLAAVIRNRNSTFLGKAPSDFREMLVFESEEEENSPNYEMLRKRIGSSTSINEGERERLYLLLEVLHHPGEPQATAIDKLLAIPDHKRYRNEFLGDAYFAIEEPEKGIACYLVEGKQFAEARYSQRSAAIAFIERKDHAQLRAVLEIPTFYNVLTEGERISAFTELRDYGRILINVVVMDWKQLSSPHLIAALFTAVIWFLILVMMGGFDSRRQIGIGLFAFFLGMFSTSLTLYLVYIQENIRNFAHHPEDTMVNQFISMIAGIGLREESMKLLCFIPVAFLIVRYRSAVFALVTAALTGLGFAMMENIQYFAGSPDGFVAWSRLLSANAMHFCLTGIVGFSFYQLLRNRGRRWENFLIDFLLVVVIHGIYDGFLMIPQLAEYSALTIIIIAGTAYRYFDLVKEHMPTSGQLRRISPLGVFVLGTALLASGIMVISTFDYGFLRAIGAFAGTAAGSIPLAFAFISRMRDL